MEKLKPCPFCGGEASEPTNETPNKRPTWVISCKLWCVFMRRQTKKEVIKDWNNRVYQEFINEVEKRLSQSFEGWSEDAENGYRTACATMVDIIKSSVDINNAAD